MADLLKSHGVPIERIDRGYPEVQAESLEEVVSAALDALEQELDDFFVDDSGLFVEALRGFPGVYSSDAYRKIGVAGLLCLLHGAVERRARFETVLGLRLGGTRHLVRGQCTGTIAEEQRGFGGFGFDPIFVPDGHAKTFAEMTTDEKNEISHRGSAARALATILSGR